MTDIVDILNCFINLIVEKIKEIANNIAIEVAMFIGALSI